MILISIYIGSVPLFLNHCDNILSTKEISQMEKNVSYFRSDDEFEVLDIHEMFIFYNNYFFEGILDKCTV